MQQQQQQLQQPLKDSLSVVTIRKCCLVLLRVIYLLFITVAIISPLSIFISACCLAPLVAGNSAHLTVAEGHPIYPRAMETVYLSPRHRGTSRSEAPLVHNTTRADIPTPGHASALLAESPPDGDVRRGVCRGSGGPGVKKHHHKHNLKHRYELLETLGRGTYGKVKKAIERQSGREVSRQSCVCVCVCFGLDQTTFPCPSVHPLSLACCQRVHRGQGVVALMLPRPLLIPGSLAHLCTSQLPPELYEVADWCLVYGALGY